MTCGDKQNYALSRWKRLGAFACPGVIALDIEVHQGPDGREYVDRKNAARAAGS
jgi:hypothetical protein